MYIWKICARLLIGHKRDQICWKKEWASELEWHWHFYFLGQMILFYWNPSCLRLPLGPFSIPCKVKSDPIVSHMKTAQYALLNELGSFEAWGPFLSFLFWINHFIVKKGTDLTHLYYTTQPKKEMVLDPLQKEGKWPNYAGQNWVPYVQAQQIHNFLFFFS